MSSPSRTIKNFIESRLITGLIGWCGWLSINIVHLTSRWEYRNYRHFMELIEENKPFIAICWHSRVLMMPRALKNYRKGRVKALISLHRDGKLIASVCRRFGMDIVQGSSKKSGVSAVMAVLKTAFADGMILGVTPDGPNGPAQVLKDGPIFIAAKTGVPILTLSMAVRRAKYAKSWDRLMIPLPFNRGVYVVGRRFDIPDNATAAELEDYRLQVEEELTRVTQEADKAVGAHHV